MIQVLEPEPGVFSVETVKKWAVETLFIEEGIIADPDKITTNEAIRVLHKHNFARIKT